MKGKLKTISALLVLVLLLNMLLPTMKVVAQEDITVVIIPESDSRATISDGVLNAQDELEGTILTYTCEDNSSFSFRVMQGDTPLTITRKTTEPEPGRYQDSYVIEHISSNNNVYIAGADIALDKIGLRLNEDGIGMFDEDEDGVWETQTLDFLADANHYQFYLEEKHNQTQPGNPNEPGNPGDPERVEDLMYDVDFGTASWVVYDKTVTASVEGKVINDGLVKLQGNEVVKLSDNFDSRLMQVTVIALEPDVDPEHCFSTRLVVNESFETCLASMNAEHLPNDLPLQFVVEKKQDQGPEMPDLPQGNTTATVTVTSNSELEGTYGYTRLGINGYAIVLDIPEDYREGDPLPEVSEAEVTYLYDEENDNGKVTLNFASLFIHKYIGTITVNDEVYNIEDYIDYTDRTDWLDHYSRQMVGFDIEVDWAENYDIVINLTEAEGKDQYIGNFLWTIDPDEKESDDYIGNSRLELVKVVYWMDFGEGEEEIVVLEEDLDRDPYIEYDPEGMVGSLVVPEGALCTMRIIPDYGYQVTSFGVNGQDIITGEAISEFSFPIHKGNFHLGAQVTKVDDKVDTKSEKVQSGSIELGKGEIDSGTVVLSVNDINPEKAKIEEFEKAAGDYEIYSYLDIDLDQVIYKGTAEDVWSNRIHNLSNEATITLKLEEGVNGNDIIIVHNIDDGDEYEVIEITSYDPETNTITFKTKSFSNYAIATKTVKEQAYELKTENFVLTFTDTEGHEFTAEIVDVMKLTDEQLKELNITREEYNKIEKTITENVKDYGTLLSIYNIIIADNQYEHNSKTFIKIKMTDEMKKYDSFKLVNIDESDFSAKDVVELKVEGDYLVGTLPHLSVYALVADTVKTTDNPITGDNIIVFIAIFGIAAVGVATTIKLNKNRKVRKH